jgi:CHAT domain-containing protein
LTSSPAGVSGGLLTLDGEGKLSIRTFTPDEELPAMVPEGILVWRGDEGPERWAILKSGGAWPEFDPDLEPAPSLGGASRSTDSALTGGDYSAVNPTIQLDPLETALATRGGELVTRSGSKILSRLPVIRRLPEDDGGLKPAVLAISSENRQVAQVQFAEGSRSVDLATAVGVPDALRKSGLLPGEYSLSIEGGVSTSAVTVLGDDERVAALAAAVEMRRLRGADDAAADLFHVEHLLSYRGEGSTPLYLGDALQFIESLPEARRTPAMAARGRGILEWMESLARDPAYAGGAVASVPLDGQTGIVEIDCVRDLIAESAWADVSASLDRLASDQAFMSDARRNGLVKLYQGVVLAESGAGREEEASTAFSEAVESLTAIADSKESQQDLLRAYNNRGNLLLVLARSGLSNHSVQIASGVDQPVLSILHRLMDAQADLQSALEIAEATKDPAAGAAIRCNLAVTFGVIADLIQTLDAPSTEGRRGFEAGQAAAQAMAEEMAKKAGEEARADSRIRARANELLGQLAYRRGDYDTAQNQMTTAGKDFAEAGLLAGVETSERVLGLIAKGRKQPEDAIRHLEIASLIAELQRSTFPEDASGQSRAGYFARHADLARQLVELHLASRNATAALAAQEDAKARSLRDLLAAAALTEGEEAQSSRSLDEILADWPADTAAIEYFLGAETAWGIVVLPGGKVHSFQLKNPDGTPLPVANLLRQVRTILSGMEHYSEKLRRQILSGRGFDHRWQGELYSLRRILVPDEVLEQLRGVKVLVVVPQHLLHYVPYSALVTQLDDATKPSRVAKPKFLLDESFSILTTPSLETWDLIRRRPAIDLKTVQAACLEEHPNAPPLPGVRTDIDNFQAVYGSRVSKILEGSKATRSAVLSILGEPGLLMLATHGNNNSDHPLQSHLMFLPDGADAADEGNVTAKDVFSTRVNASVVVLNACYCGLGDRSPLSGDDLFGVQRAFLSSGARLVLSGYWDVYDGTAPILIRRFHELLLDKNQASQALATSQREFLESCRSSPKNDPRVHPYFWAVFGICGAN